MKSVLTVARGLFYNMIETHFPRSVCIVRLSALGDVLMLVPLVRTLQRYAPGMILTWVISRPAYDLVKGLDGVEFIVMDKPKSPLDYWRFKQQMKARTFDVLLATQSSFRANLLYACIHATRKIGYDSLRAKDGHGLFIHERIEAGNDHTVDGFLRFARSLGIDKTDVRWDLPRWPSDDDWALTQLPYDSSPLLLINPAASKAERAWLVEHYITVVRYAQTRWHARVVLIGGPGEQDRVLGEAIVRETSVPSLIGQTTITQQLALLRLADVLLCPDTGPSHMATAVGTPVIALHAVSSSKVSGPYAFRHLSVDYFDEAVRCILKKTPETTVWGTHIHGMEAMKLIPVEPVLRQLDNVFFGLED